MPISMKMVLKIKATLYILVRLPQLKHLCPFDSNCVHTFLWVLPTWWKIRIVSIGLSDKTTVPISMKMVFKIKAALHILVRVPQLKDLGPFDSNFVHTFLWVLPIWWKVRTVSIGLSAKTTVQISMKMVLKIKATVHHPVRIIQPNCPGPFDFNFAHTYLLVLPTWQKEVSTNIMVHQPKLQYQFQWKFYPILPTSIWMQFWRVQSSSIKKE